MNIDINNFIYTGLFLTDKSKLMLKNKFINLINDGKFILNKNKCYFDHCTMLFNDKKLTDDKCIFILNFISEIENNYKVKLTIDAIGKYESVYAFKVSSYSKIKDNILLKDIVKNKIPHITAVLDFNKNKPVDSNKITDWVYIDPFEIDTEIKIINKRKRIINEIISRHLL